MNVNSNDDSQVVYEELPSEQEPIACLTIPSFDDFDIANYRNSLGLSQSEFAKAHDISLGTLKKWERHSSKPVFGDGFKRILDGWVQDKMAEAQYR